MKKVFLLISIALVTNTITGQNIKRYEGRMMIPSGLDLIKEVVEIYGISDAGNGYYDYYEDSEENRIKHGKFYLKVNGLDINGAYSHGKKVGQWTVIHEIGKFNKLKITYKDDVLWGPCEYTISDGLGIGTITCNFINGKLSGNASFLGKYVSLFTPSEAQEITSECRGNIDKDGLLQGVWVVSDKGGIERKQKRFYYKGALVYVEEQDLSTGEKTICFSSFNDLKRAPVIERIRDTIIKGKDGIVYEGHIAVKTDTYNYSSSSKVMSGPSSIIGGLPEGMALSKQRDSWKYAYSQNVYEKMIETQKSFETQESEMLQRLAEVRNKNEQRARENEIETAYLAFLNYIAEIRNNYIKIKESYNGSYTTAYMTTCNTNGTIRKCSNENGITTFKIGKETVSGVFSKEYVKTDAGEVFTPHPPVELLSNEDGSMLIYQYGSYRDKCVLLIIKQGQNQGVYTLSSSAQKCW